MNPIMHTFHFFLRFNILYCLLVCGFAVSSLQAAKGKKDEADLAQRVTNAHGLFSEIMHTRGQEIPPVILADAKAILVVDRFQAGFIIGIKGGVGLAMLHDGIGNWSPPAFYRVGGASFGFQAGGERSETVYLLMTDEATRMLTGDSGEIGVDLGVVAGPVGRNIDYSNITRAPVYAYTLSRGLYAGATVQGGVFSPNHKNNETLYKKAVSPLEILESRVIMPKVAEPFAEALRYYVTEGLKEKERQEKQNNRPSSS